MFWAMGEPIYHFMTPPTAIQAAASSREAAIFAVSQAMFDAIRAPRQDRRAIARGLSVIVEKEDEDNANAR